MKFNIFFVLLDLRAKSKNEQEVFDDESEDMSFSSGEHMHFELYNNLTIRAIRIE